MISVVVPVYRSVDTLGELHGRLCRVLEGVGEAFEVLFVEDGGMQDSWRVITELAAQDRRVRGIRLSRNYGQHNALLCGIRQAAGDCIVTMDDDLQHPPEELPRMLERLAQGFDVVYGTPRQARHGLLRNLATLVTKIALQGAIGDVRAHDVSAFRVFRSELRGAFENYRSPTVNIDVLLTWGTSRFSAVPVRHEARVRGESGYTLRMLARHALNMMTGFSVMPLHLASVVGFAVAIFGAGILAFVLLRWLIQGSEVPGFAFLASIITIFSGAQLLALGVMGEYLARMHFRTMERPAYVVRASTDDDDPPRS